MATKFNKSGFTYLENRESIGVYFNNRDARERALEIAGNNIPAPNCTEESNWENLSIEKKIEVLIQEGVRTEQKVKMGEIKLIHFLGTDIYLTEKDIAKYNEIRKKIGDIIK